MRLSSRLRAHKFVSSVTLAVLLTAALALIARATTISNPVQLGFAVAVPYTALLSGAVSILAILYGARILFCAGVVIVVISTGTQIQWYYLGATPLESNSGVVVRVLASNLRKGQANPAAFLKIASGDVDVIAVSELTPSASTGLEAVGLQDLFPYSLLRPQSGAFGIGIWSKFPLEPAVPPTQHTPRMAAAHLKIPGVRVDPLFVSVHITSPITAESGSFQRWQESITRLRTRLNKMVPKGGPGASIVAGDFNSTPDMRQFRDLLKDGFHDALHQTGAGWSPTFPSRSCYPPVLAIDHVLARNAQVESVKTVVVPGSDHRALLAEIRLPTG